MGCFFSFFINFLSEFELNIFNIYRIFIRKAFLYSTGKPVSVDFVKNYIWWIRKKSNLLSNWAFWDVLTGSAKFQKFVATSSNSLKFLTCHLSKRFFQNAQNRSQMTFYETVLFEFRQSSACYRLIIVVLSCFSYIHQSIRVPQMGILCPLFGCQGELICEVANGRFQVNSE